MPGPGRADSDWPISIAVGHRREFCLPGPENSGQLLDASDFAGQRRVFRLSGPGRADND